MAARHKSSRARYGGGNHFDRRHSRIAQKPSKSNLAGPVAAEWADPNAGLTNLQQAFQQKRPPFSRRRSPNRPKLCAIILSLIYLNHIDS